MLNMLHSEKLMTSLAFGFPFTFLKILSRSPPSALLNGVSRRPVCGRTKISGQRGERGDRNCYLSFSAGEKHPSEFRRNNICVGAVGAALKLAQYCRRGHKKTGEKYAENVVQNERLPS